MHFYCLSVNLISSQFKPVIWTNIFGLSPSRLKVGGGGGWGILRVWFQYHKSDQTPKNSFCNILVLKLVFAIFWYKFCNFLVLNLVFATFCIKPVFFNILVLKLFFQFSCTKAGFFQYSGIKAGFAIFWY